MKVSGTTFLCITLLFVFCATVNGFPNGYTYEKPDHSPIAPLEGLPSPAQPQVFSKGSSIYASNNIAVPLDGIGEAVRAKIDQTIDLKTMNVVTSFPDSGKQKAVLESSLKESLPIQVDIKYGTLQNFVADLLNPKPIVDTLQEHEKYGNNGEKSRGLGIFVVNAFEGISNAVNAAIDAPYQVVKTSGRKLTAALNQVGGKLVGLAK